MNKFVLRSKRSSSNKFMTEMWMMHNNCSHFLEHLYVMFFTYTISFCYDSMFTQSVQYNHSVVSDPLWSHGLQHARPSCPSPTPGVYSNSNVHWVSEAIQPSHPLSSPSPPAFSRSQPSGSFQMSQFFASGSQSIGASASTSIYSMSSQDWFPLGWTGWISLLSKGLSRVFFNTIVQKHQYFGAQLSL